MEILRENDIVVVWQDVPTFLAPFLVKSVSIASVVPDGEYHDPLWVALSIYDGYGNVRYTSNTAYPITPWGFNEIPMDNMFDEYWQMTMPVVLDNYDVYDAEYDESLGFYVGVMVLGNFYGDPMAVTSPNLSCELVNPFAGGYNLTYTTHPELGRGWYDMVEGGIPGNMGIRANIEPFVPRLVGDLDQNGAVDDGDVAEMASAISLNLGNIFNDLAGPRWLDLNNDWVLDGNDLAIINANYSGDDPVVAPWIEVLTPDITVHVPKGASASNIPFVVKNGGVVYPWYDYPPPHITTYSPLNFQLWVDQPWLTFTQSQGTSTGEAKEVGLHLETQSFEMGQYEAWIEVVGNASNTPRWARVTVIVQTPGDFNGDGSVDHQDLELFVPCVTGPMIPYSQGIPSGCTIPIDGADFDDDGDVDQEDFGLFQAKICGPQYACLQMASPSVTTSSETPRCVPGVKSSSSRAFAPVWPEAARALPDPAQLAGARGSEHRMSPWIAVGIAAIIAAIYLFVKFWRFASNSKYFTMSSVPDTWEQTRIRDAINCLNTLSRVPGADPDLARAYQFLRNTEGIYSPFDCGCEILRVNRKPVGDVGTDGKIKDESGEEGTVARVWIVWSPDLQVYVITSMAIRRDVLAAEPWDDYYDPVTQQMKPSYARIKAAFAFFGEWQHKQYGPDEKECQHKLERAVMSVQPYTGVFPFTLHYQHGEKEGVGD